ncbi:lipid-A-disaccharide synthase [Xanthovirga aplysinae]|uniref:lipid-A-disaccharide synthase n=1 Tax=Xanthovirga aplysinae TaxID=2529853 RepID=UPI0016575304|nr:lipid-A-disaccharide synthase [Xanthovirga aplysinae]
MKYYLIAGERSGDLHGSNLIKSLKKLDENAEFRAWGGDYMRDSGALLVNHYKDMAFMGALEVIKNLLTIRRLIRFCKEDILNYKPDVLVLIDYAGFNLRIAEFAKKNGVKVHYYISPKVWAWNQSRAWKIKRNVDRMFVILPFEKAFYEKYGFKVDYVGNPLLDAVREFKPDPGFRIQNQLDQRPIIAVLPGSRKQELKFIFGRMLEIINKFPAYQFVVAGVDNLPKSYYEPAKKHSNVKLVFGKTYDLLSQAHAAIVTSGTATLETALFEVPQVVCYKSTELEYQIGKRLIKVDFMSLVNLIAGKEVVKELLQHDLTAENLSKELEMAANEGEGREKIKNGYQEVKALLGDRKTSETLASLIFNAIN